jgi:hypothetical protein
MGADFARNAFGHKKSFWATLRFLLCASNEVYVLAQFEQTLCIAPQLAQRMQINVTLC